MYHNGSKRRSKEIIHFLKRLATGDLDYELELNDQQAIIHILARLPDKIKKELLKIVEKFISEDPSIQLLHVGFLLDKDLKITHFSTSELEPLLIESDIVGIPFASLLSLHSQKEFYQRVGELRYFSSATNEKLIGRNLKLDFVHTRSDATPLEGFMNIFHDAKTHFLITTFKTESQIALLETVPTYSSSAIDEIPEGKQPNKLEADRRLFNDLHHYLFEHLDKPLPKFSEIAKLIGASESKLKRGFKRVYGNSIYNYHRIWRLDKATKLLSTTDKAIKQVSLECGFVCPSHFARSFRKRYKFSPSGYRKHLKPSHQLSILQEHS